MNPATDRICGGVRERGGVRDCSVYEENRTYKIASARRGRARFTRAAAAAAAAGDSWKDSDVSISSAELGVLAISRDEGAKSDYDDEDGRYSLMNSFIYDGYTSSIVVSCCFLLVL